MTKLEKLKIADETFSWWADYATEAVYHREEVMPFGAWILKEIEKLKGEHRASKEVMSGNKFYQIEFGKCYCCCQEFIVNGIDAYYDDFGEKFDRNPARAEEYGCGNTRFTRHTDDEKVGKCLRKYGITLEQFNEIADRLEEGLSFGECGLCE